MQKWKNGNEEIFRLAKLTDSWGRIHTVEHLEPETEKIRHWLLTEGTINGVINVYSSLTCWQKSGAAELLFGELTEKECQEIATIIDGLLDEGLVLGISEIKNREQILIRFLEQSQVFAKTADDFNKILSVGCKKGIISRYRLIQNLSPRNQQEISRAQ